MEESPWGEGVSMAESQAGESKGGWVGLSLSGGLARASAQSLGTSGLCVCTGPPQPWVATPQNRQQPWGGWRWGWRQEAWPEARAQQDARPASRGPARGLQPPKSVP